MRLTATYEFNVQAVKPSIDGPFDDLVRLLIAANPGLPDLADWLEEPIEGVHFDGWLEKVFERAGCRVEDHDDGGDWVVYRE